jgi:hypothetical protein
MRLRLRFAETEKAEVTSSGDGDRPVSSMAQGSRGRMWRAKAEGGEWLATIWMVIKWKMADARNFGRNCGRNLHYLLRYGVLDELFFFFFLAQGGQPESGERGQHGESAGKVPEARTSISASLGKTRSRVATIYDQDSRWPLFTNLRQR